MFDDKMMQSAKSESEEQAQTDRELSFEERLEELEKIVRALESGKLTLADSLVYFERGYQLSRACSRELDQMEQRLKILLNGEEESAGAEEADLDMPDEDMPF